MRRMISADMEHPAAAPAAQEYGDEKGHREHGELALEQAEDFDRGVTHGAPHP
jgi:hypothetical protein